MLNRIANLKYLFSLKINVIFIHKGLTSMPLPLDTSLNRPLKDWIKRSYEGTISLFNGAKDVKNKKRSII